MREEFLCEGSTFPAELLPPSFSPVLGGFVRFCLTICPGAIPNNAAAVQAPEKTKKESKDKAKEKDTLADFGRFEELPVSVRQLVAQHATPLSASMLCFTSRANYKLFAAFELSTEKMLVECAKEGQLKLFKHIQRQFDFAWFVLLLLSFSSLQLF